MGDFYIIIGYIKLLFSSLTFTLFDINAHFIDI